jgi:hypothetical protein
MTKRYEGEAKQGNPLAAVPWDASDRAAMMALKECRATPADQALFLSWFLKATGVDEIEYRPDARLSAVAAGKRWVGKQFFDICSAKISEDKS